MISQRLHIGQHHGIEVVPEKPGGIRDRGDDGLRRAEEGLEQVEVANKLLSRLVSRRLGSAEMSLPRSAPE